MIKTNEIKIYIEDAETTRKRVRKDLVDIEKGIIKTMRENSISFKSLEQMRSFLTPKRLELLKVIKRENPNSIYNLAKIVKRSSENVNSDIKLLKQLGFVKIEKVKDNRKRSIPKVDYNKLILEIAL
tara:strand:- start:110 stop:490 length:381 start_codon:yes stop_codon:yes gene_type:complete